MVLRKTVGDHLGTTCVLISFFIAVIRRPEKNSFIGGKVYLALIVSEDLVHKWLTRLLWT